jgi:hypothetical protein
MLISAIVLLGTMAACKPKEAAPEPSEPVGQSRYEDPPRVFVNIVPEGPQSDTKLRYLATYRKNNKIARFSIEFFPQKSLEPAMGLPIRSGRGSFIADQKSDNSELLGDLKPALAAHAVPTRDIRVRELPFEFVFLGENSELGKDGGLIVTSTGHWVGAKLFLGPHQEAEMFFNFEKPGGRAEFSMKDEEYGDALLKELAKVL